MKQPNRPLYKTFCLIALCIVLASCNLSRRGDVEPTPDLGDADSLFVNTTLDTYDGVCNEDDCSLRDAIVVANQSPDHDTIVLPTGLYRLSKEFRTDDTALFGDLDIFSPITILGHGIDKTTIDGMAKDRIFHVFPDGNLQLHDMTLISGNGNDPQWKVHRSRFSCFFRDLISFYSPEVGGGDFQPEVKCSWNPPGNIDGPPGYERKVNEDGGGAIASRGILRLENVSVVWNLATNGGGIKIVGGVATINGGFLCNNTGELGGAIYNLSGDVSVSNLGICRNTAEDKGGGIYTNGGAVRIWNVTFAENSAPRYNPTQSDGGFRDRGGIYYNILSNSFLLNVTFADNQATGIISTSGEVAIRNSLLVHGELLTFNPNCAGSAIDSLGHNIESLSDCGFNNSNDLSRTDGQLSDSLSDYGGHFSLLPGSPAIDSASDDHCPTRDQEGESRPQGNGCDIGADEVSFQPLSLPPEEATAETPSATPRPTDQPTNTPSPPTLTPTTMELAGIVGGVWQDDDEDEVWARYFETGLANYTVRLGTGACPSTGYATDTTDGAGVYFFGDLQPGTYCVSVVQPPKCEPNSTTAYTTPTTDTSFTVNLNGGDAATIRFGFKKTLCVE